MGETAIDLETEQPSLTRPEHPMEPDAIAEAMRTLQNGQRVIVWYKPINEFNVHRGEFSIGETTIEEDEVDFMVKSQPLVAQIYDALEEGEEWDDDDPASGTFHDLVTATDIEYDQRYVDALWSIEPDPGYSDGIARIDVADSRFVFDGNAKTVTLDNEPVDLADLEVLHAKIGEHLANI